MTWHRPVTFFALTAGVAAAVVGLAPTPHPAIHAGSASRIPREPCVEAVAGPSPLYFCADGRAWQEQDGRWVDAGVLTPLPQVPQS